MAAFESTIREILQQSELLNSLDGSQVEKILPEMCISRLEPSEVLFEQGEQGNSLIVVIEGMLSVTVRTEAGVTLVVDYAEPGQVFGETALLTGQPRNATLTAIEPTEVLCLSRAGFYYLADHAPDVVEKLSAQAQERIRHTQLQTSLSHLFGDCLDQTALEQICRSVEWQILCNGRELFHQNDSGDSMYIVVSGLLRVVATMEDGEDRILGEIGPGGAIGEMALLTGRPRSATVYALRETVLVRLSRTGFERLVTIYPELYFPVARLIADRVIRNITPGRPSWARSAGLALTLVPLQPDVPLVKFASPLAEALGRWGKTLYLDADEFDRRWGRTGLSQAAKDDPLHTAISNWFGEQECAHSHIVYCTDHGWSDWTQRCVQQADHVVLVGKHDAPGNGEQTRLEEALREHVPHARFELVLVHPPETDLPRGTAKWLRHRNLHAHHHVRLGEHQHIRRVARRLSGRGVGLVLSGGAARGYVHVGVFRALEEVGIEIDVVGGTSAGAWTGSMFAFWNYETTLNVVKKFGSNKLIYDRSLPVIALNRSRRITGIFERVLGDRCVEDSWRTFFSVASDLTRAKTFIIEAGPMAFAVRASTAIPGIWTPVMHDGQVLVDGAVMNNFPVALMAQKIETGTVIGVNVSPPRETPNRYEIGTDVSGWQVLWNHMNPFAASRRIPSLAGLLMRVLDVNSIQRNGPSQPAADLLIQPDLARFTPLDWDVPDEIVAAGYECGRADIAAWLGESPERLTRDSYESKPISVG